jgi:glycosyltransferase involved in cell wall biosynthesis
MMKFRERYYKPFMPGWFLQRTFVVLKERRLPDLSLFILKFKSLWNKSDIREYTKIPEELIPPATFLRAVPFSAGEPGMEKRLSINSYFDQVYVVSPHSRSDTRLAMIRKLNHLNIKATIIETDDSGTFEDKQQNSFLHALKDAINNHFNRILVLEDSVVFTKEFRDKFAETITKLPDDWHLLYLGAYQDGWTEGTDLVIPPESNPLKSESLSLYHPIRTYGSFALGIHNSIFHILDKELRKDPSSKKASPFLLRGISREKSFVVFPNLVIPEDGLPGSQGSHLSVSNKWDADNYDKGPGPELVSVIMPAYNAEKTIEQSIRSILRQTYSNVEMIVADDGSTDNTLSIVRSLMKDDPRIILVDSKINRGCYFARNDAIRQSSGKYIAVQDADDISLSKRIEKQLIPILSGNAEFSLAWILRSRLRVTELDISDEAGMIRRVLENRRLRPDYTYGYWDRPILGFMTSLYRRSLFEELGLFWEYRFGADAEFFERILYKMSGKILKSDEPNVHSLLLQKNSIPGIYSRIEEILLISGEMNEQNITNTYRKEELNRFIKNYRAKYAGEFDYSYPELGK